MLVVTKLLLSGKAGTVAERNKPKANESMTASAYIMLKLNPGHMQWTKIILEESFGARCGPSISSDYNPRETILAA